MKGPLCHQLALPFGLLWYFAVFSVASCYCVNKFVLKYTKIQARACPFSATPILTRWGRGGGDTHGYVLSLRMPVLLALHPQLTGTIVSVPSLPNLRIVDLE